jgi:hypothetical protein
MDNVTHNADDLLFSNLSALPGNSMDMGFQPHLRDEANAFTEDFWDFLDMEVVDEHPGQHQTLLPSSIAFENEWNSTQTIDEDHLFSGSLSTTVLPSLMAFDPGNQGMPNTDEDNPLFGSTPSPLSIEPFVDQGTEVSAPQQSGYQVSNQVLQSALVLDQAEAGSSSTAAPTKKKVKEKGAKKQKRTDEGDTLPGQFYFYVNSKKPTFQSKTKHSAVRRQELKRLKENGGACLRCRQLKRRVIPSIYVLYFSLESDFWQCSGGNPCNNCFTATNSTQAVSLRWMPCIQTSLTDVSVFDYGMQAFLFSTSYKNTEYCRSRFRQMAFRELQ